MDFQNVELMIPVSWLRYTFAEIRSFPERSLAHLSSGARPGASIN
jgi:hypothetical protein